MRERENVTIWKCKNLKMWKSKNRTVNLIGFLKLNFKLISIKFFKFCIFILWIFINKIMKYYLCLSTLLLIFLIWINSKWFRLKPFFLFIFVFCFCFALGGASGGAGNLRRSESRNSVSRGATLPPTPAPTGLSLASMGNGRYTSSTRIQPPSTLSRPTSRSNSRRGSNAYLDEATGNYYFCSGFFWRWQTTC